jgi:hypothetical protein
MGKMNLTQLSAKYGSDKGGHGYTSVYEEIFKPLQHDPLNLLEIGLQKRGGDPNILPSLWMWRDYFSKAEIFGFDSRDFSGLASKRITIFRGDQKAKHDLAKILEICPQFDIIIDDGSHFPYDQQCSFWFLFAYLRENGYYIIEDLHFVERLKQLKVVQRPKVLATKDFLEHIGWKVSFHCNEKLAIVQKIPVLNAVKLL